MGRQARQIAERRRQRMGGVKPLKVKRTGKSMPRRT